MPGKKHGQCGGCSQPILEGDSIFSREIGKVTKDSIIMLPLFEAETGGLAYCEGCAQTVLNMSAQEIAVAKEALKAHIARG